ncbi:cbb3-type cytochrome c oxidase subunit I [Methylobacterium sp. V23]|uniref:cbb3-type cytochrome c oxidase subunit I n=2 Tax=Pseudomonadota TaxID=1224 RepID=UPI001AECA150|nr:cbb3-type cytochrome c oxidase subunit I [Methylobacterium sp. V23]
MTAGILSPTNAVRSKPQRDGTAPPTVEHDLIRAHGLAAVITLLISAVFGTLVAVKFTFPDFLGGSAWATWGRLRYDHTQGILFGWLGNAFLAYLYHAVPRLADRPVTSPRLGWALFLVWNFVVLVPGWALVLAAPSHWLIAPQALEWAEFPLAVDVFVTLGLALMVVQFVLPFLRARVPGGLYVSAWYIIGGTVFTLLAYPVGNIVPQVLPGAKGAAFSGLWIHDAVGLYITPFAVSIAYFVIPATTRRPIYSHFLSMIGFWLLFFVYPLNGTHHYVYSAIPMDAQKAAIIASAYLGMDVILVVFNQLMSLKGQSGLVGRDVPLRYVWTGLVFYLIVSLQGSLQALMPINRLTHFSDWVIGHSHLAMLGFATFVAAGGLTHVWRLLPAARYHAGFVAASYWLLLSGLLLMVIDLTAVGLVQGELWGTTAPWIDSVRASYPYWALRSLSAVPLLLGFLALLGGLTLGPATARRPAPEDEAPAFAPTLQPAE